MGAVPAAPPSPHPSQEAPSTIWEVVTPASYRGHSSMHSRCCHTKDTAVLVSVCPGSGVLGGLGHGRTPSSDR